MNYKIVFLDIDGTILTPEHTIQDSTKHAVASLQEQGIKVVIATGRATRDAIEVARELNIDSYITFNGAMGTVENKELFKVEMDEDIVRHVIEVGRNELHDVFLMTKEQNYTLFQGSDRAFKFQDLLKIEFQPIEEMAEAKVIGVTILMNQAGDAALYQLKKQYELTAISENILKNGYDITSSHVNKATAIEQVLTHYGIDASEAVAFGDGMNDKEMLRYVGSGIAMGNASPLLHPYANLVTTKVTEDGIWNGLKTIGLIK